MTDLGPSNPSDVGEPPRELPPASRNPRGRFTVFFGYAAGVGKTYEMLEAAQTLAIKGGNVLIGYVEPHGRPETEAMLLGLDILPSRIVDYRGIELREFDLDAAIKAHPSLIVVDELAHTNPPGSRHVKRWQDIEELLEAGIDVYTTLNVQHLESLNDVIAQITGIAVQETLPDTVFDMADEIKVIDLPPDALMERLREGKVYMPAQAERAMLRFFCKPNLIALRELAMRRTADQINRQAEDRAVLERKPIKAWPTAERLLVCVGPSPTSATVIRAAKRLSVSLRADWIAACVETPHTADMSEKSRQQFLRNLKLAEQLGAETVNLAGERVADEILAYAASRRVTKIVVGKTSEPWWRFDDSIVNKIIRRSGETDVYVIRGVEEPPEMLAPVVPKHRSWTGPLYGLLSVAVVTVLNDGLRASVCGKRIWSWGICSPWRGSRPDSAKSCNLGLSGSGSRIRFLLCPAVRDLCRGRYPILRHLRGDACHCIDDQQPDRSVTATISALSASRAEGGDSLPSQSRLGRHDRPTTTLDHRSASSDGCVRAGSDDSNAR